MPLEPSTRRLLLLGERKLKGLPEKDPGRGSMATERMNMAMLVKRMRRRMASPSPIFLVNILSFHFEPGFFRPQEGHCGAERLTSLLQLGQSSELRVLVECMVFEYCL